MAEPLPEARLLLETRGLSAGYGGTVVLTGIDLKIRGGDWFGLLGANGSGKSTLLRTISGQLPMLGGAVGIDGIDLGSAPERAKGGFGYAVDPSELPRSLTGRQYLALVASIRGCAPTAWPHPDLLGLLSLQPWMDYPIGTCSLGTRGKFSIAAALLGAPPLLILDEALNGLDPIVSVRVRRLLADLVGTRRHAVILSTHMLEQVSGVCTEVMLLDDGAIAHTWRRAELLAAYAQPGGLEASLMRAFEGK
jgi:ABC-2 type transport system ATP-binding protein